MESCKGNPKNSSCLNCPVQHDRNSINWTKYFGSDHLKFKRMKKFKCKSKRIRLLALPKHYRPKYSRLNPDERIKKTIEISRDEQLSTRIRMLAVPKVRRLVASFEEYKKFVSEEKLNNIQQLVGHSMMTMYSRLANIHLAENRQCRKKWTKHDWQRHCEWLKKRACPKKPFCLKKKKCPEKILPLSELEYSIFRLSQPRHAREKYRPDYGYHSVIKDACKEYKPTERIIELATPKKPVDPIKRKRTIDVEEEPVIFYANPNALTYNATDRIIELANPKSRPQKLPREDPFYTKFGVVRRALRAATSERTLELAKPKMKDEDEEERPNVNPKALKAKPTPRILELAKPRVVPQ